MSYNQLYRDVCGCVHWGHGDSRKEFSLICVSQTCVRQVREVKHDLWQCSVGTGAVPVLELSLLEGKHGAAVHSSLSFWPSKPSPCLPEPTRYLPQENSQYMASAEGLWEPF